MNTKFALPIADLCVEMQKDAVQVSGIWRSCLNCQNWSNSTESKTKKIPPTEFGTCLKYKQRPPDLTVVIGCRYWEIDIPF